MGNAQTQTAEETTAVESAALDFTGGQIVITPYGKSAVDSIREDGIIIVKPLTWALATGRPPVFFMNAKDVKPFVEEEISVESTDTAASEPIEEALTPTEEILPIAAEEAAVESTEKAEVTEDASAVAADISTETDNKEADPESIKDEAAAPLAEVKESPAEETVTPISSEAAPAVVEAVAEPTEILSLAEPVPSAEPVVQAEPAIPVAPAEKDKDDPWVAEPKWDTSAAPASPISPVTSMKRRGSISVLHEVDLTLTPDMFEIKPELDASASTKSAVLATGKDLLIGWQIQLTDVPENDNGIRVITASKKLTLQPTQFSLARSASNEQKTWSCLKRNKDKTGLGFKLMRKVIDVRE